MIYDSNIFEVKVIGDQIASLSLDEARQLREYLIFILGDDGPWGAGVLAPIKPNPPVGVSYA